MRPLINSLFKLLFHNFGYKLLAVFLSIIVWAIIQGEQVQEVNREVIVNIIVPEGYAIRGDVTRVKAATVRGSQAWLLEVPKRLVADIAVDPKVGEHRIHVGKQHIKDFSEKSDISITVYDASMDIYVDKLVERSVPIRETIQGLPHEGFSVEKVSIEPKTVLVKGVRKDILELKAVNTEAIDVSGLQANKVQDVRLITPSGLGLGALTVDTVRATVQVGGTRLNRRFTQIPLQVTGTQRRTRVSTQFVSILVQAVPNVLNDLKREDFKAFIEADSLGPGRYEEEIKVKIPPDTTLIETLPEKSIVTVFGD
jgi:YbbR domain-containing protein